MALTPAPCGDHAGLRRVELLWLAIVPLAVVAAVAVGMHLAGMVGGDTAAHVYKTELVRHHQSIVWDNDWYGGSYSIITYGPVYYWLAQYVPGSVIAVVSREDAAFLDQLSRKGIDLGTSATYPAPGSYLIKQFANPWNPAGQLIVIVGADRDGALLGARNACKFIRSVRPEFTRP